MHEVPVIHDGYIIVDGKGQIIEVGHESQKPNLEGVRRVDLQGDWIWPTWCDSHTHSVFPYYRSDEFEKRLRGVSYQQIALEGGGILNTAERLQEYTEEELLNISTERVKNIIAKGTGALEIKSGYGLTLESELKILRVIKELKSIFPIPIKATLLAAHAIPKAYAANRDGYIEMILGPLLDQAVQEELIDFMDVFCETGYFTAEETKKIIQGAAKHGIKSKIHTNQFTSIGGIQTAVEEAILSVDHLEVMTDEDVHQLSQSSTTACLLPIAPFFLNDPYPPGRQLIDQGAIVALATDFNPGSAPSHDMALAICLACIKCGLSPLEAINGATVNGAHAMEMINEVGSIASGMRANFIRTPAMKTLADIPYRICSENVKEVILNGEVWGQ